MAKIKKNFLTIIIGSATLVLAVVGVITAIKLYTLRNQAVAPTRPESQPAASTDSCQAFFDEQDKLFCSATQTQITVTGKVALVPDGSTLQTSFYIVNPPSLKTNQEYKTRPIKSGDTFTVEGIWPGTNVAKTGEIVEIHFGLNILDQNGNPLQNCTDGLDYYWNQPLQNQCTATIPPTTTPTQTPTVITTTPLPNQCDVSFTLGTQTSSPTPTPTVTATATATASPTPTPTIVATSTSSPTSTPVIAQTTTTPLPQLPEAGIGSYTMALLGGGGLLIFLAILAIF